MESRRTLLLLSLATGVILFFALAFIVWLAPPGDASCVRTGHTSRGDTVYSCGGLEATPTSHTLSPEDPRWDS